MTPDRLPFNRPHTTGREIDYIRQAVANAHLSGDGPFTKRCQRWLEERIGSARALLTHSCTAALEMTALLADLRPGDEVVMPSFTFVSTANAFVLRGAVPVFVDLRVDTLNIDESRIEAALTARTRAIVAVHYAGVACEMDVIASIAAARNLLLIEDAAQAFGSTYRDTALGRFGQLATLSFHETKNIMAGEGGALLVNDAAFTSRAEVLRQKGTDRSRFLRGETDKYSWQDVGSSFLPSEITAAFLWAQIEDAREIGRRRIEVWNWYFERFLDLERRELIRRPFIPAHCGHNGHLFYLLLPKPADRTRILSDLNAQGINAVFHYVPLHTSPAGRRLARASGSMDRTIDASERLIRLPLWLGMTREDVDRVATAVERAL